MPVSPVFHASRPWLTLVGIGEDGFGALVPDAQQAIAEATLIVGGQRHLDLIAGYGRARREVWPHPFPDVGVYLAPYRGRQVVVLASGDPFFYGVGSALMNSFATHELVVHPGQSCLTLACARLGWAVQDITVASLCGRPLSTLRTLIHDKARLIVLSADETTPAHLAAWLCAEGYSSSVLHILEAMGGPRERLRRIVASDPVPAPLDRLNLVAINVIAARGTRPIPLSCGIPDALFEHDGQITRQAIRAMTLSALEPCPGEVLWDLGAGSGSIGIEWMLCHRANRAIAIERDAVRVARIRRNAETLGVPGLHVKQRNLPDDLSDLPRPDAIFIGGGVSHDGLIESAWSSLSPGSRLVANAVTLEGEYRLFKAFQEWGGELSRIGMERLGALGNMFGFRPEMTVIQYRIVKS